MAKKTVEVTIVGTNKLDRKLARMPIQLQRKAIRKATREVAKQYRAKVKRDIPVETGAMAAAVQVRSVTRSLKAGTGKYMTARRDDGELYGFEVQKTFAKEYGAKVEITRKSLAKQLEKIGNTTQANEVLSGEYFYPALVELGGRKRRADGSMRRQVKASRGDAIREFRKHLTQFIREQSTSHKVLTSVSSLLGGRKK